MAGTNRMTVLRRIGENRCENVLYGDQKGWSLFSERDINRLKFKTNKRC
jgi:hypothetical protein